MCRPYIAIFLMLLCGCGYTNYVDTSAPPIIQAAQRGQFSTVKMILAGDPSALHHKDKNGNTAAICGILSNNHKISIYLIEQGYPVNPTNDHPFPLVMACLSRYTKGSYDMLEYLLDHGADPNITFEKQGWVAVNMAANNGMEDKVRLLVRFGAKLDVKDGRGQTPLDMANECLSKMRDPKFNYPHGELSDPKVRKQSIEKWESMVKLLEDLSTKP